MLVFKYMLQFRHNAIMLQFFRKWDTSISKHMHATNMLSVLTNRYNHIPFIKFLRNNLGWLLFWLRLWNLQNKESIEVYFEAIRMSMMELFFHKKLTTKTGELFT